MTIAIATPILAIDLGMFNSVFCRYDSVTKAHSARYCRRRNRTCG